MKYSIIFLIILVQLIFACKNGEEDHSTHESEEYYTCPMHSSVKSHTPGTCPVCNMTLIKVEKKESSHEGNEGNFIILDQRQQVLAGIETDTAKFTALIPTSTILGIVALDEERTVSISSRVEGRIDKLFIKSSSEYVQKGSPIYGIYSEELFADEKEYIALLEKKNQGSNKFLEEMLEASRNKLLLWGLTNKQILELEKSKSASELRIFYAPSGGYVMDVYIKEGMYVEEGTQIMKLTNLNQVWVEAQVYTNDIIADASSFLIHQESFPDEIYKGRLVYDNPIFEDGRKIRLIRLKVDNSRDRLIPGMMVYVRTSQKSKPVLVVPKSALLLEKMNTVWVKTDETTFEQRMVRTGSENNNFVEIISGLREGEIVVTSGAYLISSEFTLKSGAGQRHDH